MDLHQASARNQSTHAGWDSIAIEEIIVAIDPTLSASCNTELFPPPLWRLGDPQLTKTQLDISSLARLPEPNAKRIAMRVTPEAERALRQGHPWLFEQAITSQSHAGQAGDLAIIFDRKKRFLAVGLYDPHSSIRVRILHHGNPAAINQDWFSMQLATALRLRDPLLHLPPERKTSGYRLVHGENDGLPGLVIDRYAGTLVLKLYSPAWLPHLKAILSALADLWPHERLALRLGRALQDAQGQLHGLTDGMILYGPELAEPVLFRENGLQFEADPLHGQKTGFFLDQRENRRRVEALAGGKHVLNLFSYTGGFSVYAARGGARSIISVDTSQPALDAARRNMAHNSLDQISHETRARDVFEILKEMAQAERRFNLVIVDPPAFAQNKIQVRRAIMAYKRLTRLSLTVLAAGGTLVQASCSSHVDADTFFNMVHSTAARAGRPLREIERTGHALDHPIAFKEGAYLKCLFAVAP